MRDYHINKNYNKGYKSAPEVVLLAIILGYLVVNMSWDHIFKYFGF